MKIPESYLEKYKEYLKDPIVRKNHKFILDMFNNIELNNTVVDLGGSCGLYTDEGGWIRRCLVIDPVRAREGLDQLELDYRTLEILPDQPDAFVSLFATECFEGEQAAARYYSKWFKNTPSLQRALVSGFYNRDSDTLLQWVDGVAMHTCKPEYWYHVDGVTVVKTMIPTPSKFFGPNTVEVWKILTRNS